MNNKEALLSKRWIIKEDDKELYYRIKDDMKNLSKLFQETLGYSLTNYQNCIKLDKIPGKAEPWMGITEFKSIQEYQMLCYILIFLEDKAAQEQFILSHLTEFIQLQLKVSEEYWLQFAHRKKLVNVLKFCLKEQLFIQDDGNTEGFMQSENIEVLFENTGFSRYFMRNISSNILDNQTPQDFMKEEWVGLEQDRGIVRKQRIYRRLMLSCGIYKENDDNDDFAFIHNYRKRIARDFEKIIPCDLHVYQSSAYLILDESVRIGQLFPKNNAMDEMIVLMLTYLREHVKSGYFNVDMNEMIVLSTEQVNRMIKKVIKQNINFLPVTYRQKNIDNFCGELYEYLLQLGFAHETENQVVFFPVVAKLTGRYEEN